MYSTSMPYAEAHDMLAAAGRKDRKGFHFAGWLRKHESTGIAGRQIRRVDVALPIRGIAGRVNYDGRPNLGRVLRMPELARGRYIVIITGHAFAIVGGRIHDQYRAGDRSKVFGVWEVTPVPEVSK
jgi:hypothetical protein